MELAKLGPERATAAIYHSIANNWKGIFEPQNVGGQQPDVMKNLRDYANGVAP